MVADIVGMDRFVNWLLESWSLCSCFCLSLLFFFLSLLLFGLFLFLSYLFTLHLFPSIRRFLASQRLVALGLSMDIADRRWLFLIRLAGHFWTRPASLGLLEYAALIAT